MSWNYGNQNNGAANVAIDIVSDDMSVERYVTLPGVMTFLVNFNTMTITIKERDVRGIPKPNRYFNLTEFFPQTQAQTSTEANLQSQIDELKSLIIGLSNQNNQPQQMYNNNQKKGGNNK